MVVPAVTGRCISIHTLSSLGVLVSSYRFRTRGWHSSWSWGGEEGVDQDLETTPLGRRLNQVYEEVMTQKMAPSWLPLQPTASYWVPPSAPLTELLKISPPSGGKQMSDREILSLLTRSSWVEFEPKPESQQGMRALKNELLNGQMFNIV